MRQTVYVSLLNEGTAVWAPVDAIHVRDDIYRIEDCRDVDAELEFGNGAFVRCRMQALSGGENLVAYALAS